MSDLELMEELMEKMKQPEQKGFVFLPGAKGFDILEFDVTTLRLAIAFASNYEKSPLKPSPESLH